MKFVFATHNNHKVFEINKMITDQRIQIQSLSDINMHQEIIEDGSTLDENAWIKSNFIYSRYGGNVIADDTGLEVDALKGAPGVYSARYAGADKNSENNMDLLLQNLKEQEDRSAQFRTIIAAWINDEKFTFEGIIRGQIAYERSGTNGFGYDPIFIPEGYSQTFGALEQHVKNMISHRGRAFQAFRQHLKTIVD